MMKKCSLVLLLCAVLLFVFALSACSNREIEDDKLSLDKVIELSGKGSELSWEDFEKFSSTDIGSGLHILRYEVDENYYLLIGGGSKDIEPMYIYLINANDPDDYIDIRTDDVNSFISK